MRNETFNKKNFPLEIYSNLSFLPFYTLPAEFDAPLRSYLYWSKHCWKSFFCSIINTNVDLFFYSFGWFKMRASYARLNFRKSQKSQKRDLVNMEECCSTQIRFLADKFFAIIAIWAVLLVLEEVFGHRLGVDFCYFHLIVQNLSNVLVQMLSHHNLFDIIFFSKCYKGVFEKRWQPTR